MSGTTSKPGQRNERDCFNDTTTTLADTLSDHASSIPAWQRSDLLRDVLKSMGEATASGQSITREVVYAKVWEKAWESRMKTNPLAGDEILEWNLQYVTILMDCDDLESVMFPPPGLEYLVSPNKAHMASKKRGELFSKVARLVLRKRGPQSLQMARKYLHLALEAYVNAKAYDKESLLPIAQDLADVLEFQGDIGLESEHFGKESIVPRWLAKGVKQGGMSVARQWCESKELDKDQFYEAQFYETKDAQKLSPLALATLEEHREAFTAMLRFTARTVTPHRMSSIASKLLLLASDTCNSDFAKDLLDSGAKANTLDEHRRSSLHRLVLCRKYGDQGGFKMIKMLLDSDPSILDFEDDNGKTALTLACEAGYALKIEELLKYGANPNTQDSHLCSPFFIACGKGSDRMIKLFLDHDKIDRFRGTLDINAPGPGKQTPLIAAVRYAARVDSKDSGALNAIKLLKQHGTDPNQKDCEGLSALDYANGFKKSQIKHILKRHTTMGSVLSVTSIFSNSRADYASSVHSSHGHTSGGESSTAKQSSPTRPVGRVDKPEALDLEALTENINSSEDSPENNCKISSDCHIESADAGTSCQATPVTLSPQSRKGTGRIVENEIIAPSDTPEIVSLHSSDPGSIGDGATSPRHGNADKTAGIFVEGETSDEFEDISWGSDDDFEDLAGLDDAPHPVKKSTHGKASGPRQCPNHTTRNNYNGLYEGMTPSNDTPSRGTPASESGSTNANNLQGEGIHTIRDDPSQPAGEPEGESTVGRFACVYCKAYPLLFPQCLQEAFESIARLKQHLARKHYEQYYCSRCQETFRTQEARDQHISGRSCQPRAADIYVRLRITEQQKRILSRCPQGQRGDAYKQWFSIFDLLFPERVRPNTPWADPAASVFSTLRQEFRGGITTTFITRINQADVGEVASILGDWFDELLERQSRTQDLADVANQQDTPVPSAAPSPSYSLDNGSHMHDNPHGAAFTQSPSVSQSPPSLGSTSANATPRSFHRPIPTLSQIQQPPTTLYLSGPNQFHSLPAGFQYHLSSNYHNDINPQANMAAQWSSQTQQSLSGAFSPSQSFQAPENMFSAGQQAPGGSFGNFNVVSAFPPEVLNPLMYNHSQFGTLPPQGYPTRASPMHRPNEGLHGGFQGQPQAGQGSPTSGHQSLNTDVYSEGGDVQM